VKTDSSIAQLLQVRLQLRPELRCTLQTSGRTSYCQLEDPLTRRFYRLGLREWELARRMDGQRMLGEILQHIEQTGPGQSLSPADAIRLTQWLVQIQLANVVGRLTHPLLGRSQRPRSMPAWLNPVFLRIPLFNPDPLLSRSLPWLNWTLSPPAVAMWCFICLIAFWQVVMQWSQFVAPITSILAPGNWLYLLLAWASLKAIHEFYHGLACKRFGGHVPACGIALILFSPVAFVDVTSSWRFRSKWQRIFTAAAGMYAELFVASVTTLIWSQTDEGLLRQICHNVIFMASVSTLLFNSNFLMRFDGYYIFSDLLDLQNLYGSGQQYIRYLARRYFLGIPTSASHLVGIKGNVVRAYGIAALCWRMLFYVGVMLTAAHMFRGAGIIISLLVCVGWILLPAARFVQYVIHGRGTDRPNRRRVAGIIAAAVASLVGLALLPWPGGVVTTGVVDYEPLAWVRAESPGFVRILHVRPGQEVRAGAPLLTVDNPRTQLDLSDVDVSIKQAEIRGRMLQGEDDYASLQVEQKHVESLNEQRSELAEKVARLRITAPIDGRVIGRELNVLQDQYLQTGQEVLAIGSEAYKSIVVAVPQEDVEFFLKQVGAEPRVRVRGRWQAIRTARLDKVDPRATDQPPHAALSAANGGPLPVASSTVHSSDTSDAAAPRLLEPHFRATIWLPRDIARELHAGQLARVRLGSGGETIGAHVQSLIENWVRRKLQSG
jgi:putative peptide zinc metalloprotease protein